MPWIPDSNSATVREPAGRVAAFSLSSANSVSKFFTPSRVLAWSEGPLVGPLRDGGDVSEDIVMASEHQPRRHRGVLGYCLELPVLLQGDGGRQRRGHGLVALVL
jgi:hypothetical protein